MTRLAAIVLAVALGATVLLGAPAAITPTGAATPAAGSPADDEGWPWWPPAAPAVLSVDTGGQPIGREDYVEATMTLDGATRATEIRGRGNSTWGMPKKPYKLKLEEDAALLGTREYDEWVLLAQYADRSALRTAIALTVASRTRLSWTPRFRLVDLVIDGQPRGLYMLTEQVELGEGRVEVPEDGHLLEANQRFRRDGEPGFRSKRGTAVAFKDPDEVTRAQRRRVRSSVENFEDVLYGPDFADRRTGYRKYIDVASVIDWYLVEELLANTDSNFQSSVHFTWTPGGKYIFGPVWDFDLSAGTRWGHQVGPVGWHTRQGTHWISRMLEDPAFSNRVKSRWARLRPSVEQVLQGVPQARAVIAPSAAADWAMWHTVGVDLPWSVHADDHAAEVAFVQDWLASRVRWLSRNEVRFGASAHSTPERDRTVWVPVQLQAATAQTVSVDYEVVGGTATAGTDFEARTGRVTFAPGERKHRVPVRIVGDAASEAAETVLVRLTSGNGPGDLVVGSPGTATVTIRASDQELDASISRAGGRFVGAGTIDAAGRRQLLRAGLAAGASRAYDVRVANPGTHAVTLRLLGRQSGPLTVGFARRGDDLTGRLTSSRGLSVRVQPGRAVRVRMVVTVRPGAERGATGQALLRAVWRGDVKVIDTVGVRARVR